MSNRRPWRRCSACGGVCHWHDTDWVCDTGDDGEGGDNGCGSEWNEDHDPKYRAPGGDQLKESTHA